MVCNVNSICFWIQGGGIPRRSAPVLQMIREEVCLYSPLLSFCWVTDLLMVLHKSFEITIHQLLVDFIDVVFTMDSSGTLLYMVFMLYKRQLMLIFHVWLVDLYAPSSYKLWVCLFLAPLFILIFLHLWICLNGKQHHP